ncbi:hypothetical protein N7532_001182 [Penicillium argentinense]|uniref:Uncharacterized protein n=1 Tax=Penicillium argentinense TaxID=1131581 RepID=A0A9W9G3L9_9EURO|nr:uncharacterized protein N7532_001182 [Penicillium argentinense]KAJ5110647.1 hypothetical protein N7532_001182 [Penicillium argentinense]
MAQGALTGYDRGLFGGIETNTDFLNTINNPNDALLRFVLTIYNLDYLAGCLLNFMTGNVDCHELNCVTAFQPFRKTTSDQAATSTSFSVELHVNIRRLRLLNPMVPLPEILLLHARAKGTAIGFSSNWLWSFVIVMITPTIFRNIEWNLTSPSCTQTPHSSRFVYFCYPETANLTLEEIYLPYSEHGTSALHVAEIFQKQIREKGQIGPDTESTIDTEVVHDDGKE